MLPVNAISIHQAAEILRADAESVKDCRHVDIQTISVGQMFCQGDIGILCIEKLPKDAVAIEWPKDGQVAPGVTKGSRHCVAPCRGQFYRFGGDDLSDLCFDAYETWTMTHPEHGHVTAKPGLFQFCHEQNEQNMRVRD